LPGPRLDSNYVPAATILIVDDDAGIRALLVKILVAAGHVVREYKDGAEALAAAQAMEGRFDLLVTDIKMPGMSGLQLARSVTESYPAVRVLCISGYFDAEDVPDQPLGFAFLSKPFGPLDLIHSVEKALARRKQPLKASGQADKQNPQTA